MGCIFALICCIFASSQAEYLGEVDSRGDPSHQPGTKTLDALKPMEQRPVYNDGTTALSDSGQFLLLQNKQDPKFVYATLKNLVLLENIENFHSSFVPYLRFHFFVSHSTNDEVI